MGIEEYLFVNCEPVAEFALRAGVSINTVYKLIKGKKLAHKPTARRILKATDFKLDLADILAR